MKSLNVQAIFDKLRLIGGKDSSSTTVYILYIITIYVLLGAGSQLDEQTFKVLFVVITSAFGIILNAVQNRNNTEKKQLREEILKEEQQKMEIEKQRLQDLTNLADGYTRALDKMRFILEMILTSYKNKLSIEPIIRLIEAELQGGDTRENPKPAQ